MDTDHSVLDQGVAFLLQPGAIVPIPTRELRYVLIYLLDTRGGSTASVAELVRLVEESGISLSPPENKAISDAMRPDVGRGRIVRARRGVYVIGVMPKSTRTYCKTRGRDAIAHYGTQGDGPSLDVLGPAA